MSRLPQVCFKNRPFVTNIRDILVKFSERIFYQREGKKFLPFAHHDPDEDQNPLISESETPR